MDSPFLLTCLDDLPADLDAPPFSNLLSHTTWPSYDKSAKRHRDSFEDNAHLHARDWEPSSAAPNPSKTAKTKASREKARRERINERFAELARLCDGEDPKVDKSSILLDAIKNVKRQRMENQQLKQLNKFLEDRVSQYEKERNEFFSHQDMLMQPSLRTETVVPGIPVNGRSATAASPHNMSDCVVADPTGNNEGGCVTAMGFPVVNQKFSPFPDTGSAANNGALWAQSDIVDTSNDHLLRPPAA